MKGRRERDADSIRIETKGLIASGGVNTSLSHILSRAIIHYDIILESNSVRAFPKNRRTLRKMTLLDDDDATSSGNGAMQSDSYSLLGFLEYLELFAFAFSFLPCSAKNSFFSNFSLSPRFSLILSNFFCRTSFFSDFASARFVAAAR